MRVAAVQHDIVWEDRDANFSRLAPMIADAAGAGARLISLTETYSTGFSLATERIAEGAEGPSTEFLVGQAATTGAWVAGSIPILAEPGALRPHNVLTIAGPGGELHRYRKIHPFTYGGEHERFDAGAHLTTVTIEGVRVSLFVCYDLRFADEFWALAHQTDCYLVPANWPGARRLHWQTLLQARAIENQAYVIGVNRVGTGGGLDYTGDSRIIDPFGEILAGGAGAETILLADVDPVRVADVRASYPFLADRR